MQNILFSSIWLKKVVIFSKTFVLSSLIFYSLISCSVKYNMPDLKNNAKNDSLRVEYFKHEVYKLNLADGDTLVDIGSFDGYNAFQLFHFYPNKYFVLEDITKRFYKKLKNPYIIENGQKKYFKDNSIMIKGTQETIPLKSNMYKTILCRRSLHEFKKPAKMINEIKRIMTQDGILIIVEISPKVKGELDSGCKMKHISKDEIVSLLSQNGLRLFSSDTSTYEIKNSNESNFNILTFMKN